MGSERSLPLPESSFTDFGSFAAHNDLALGEWAEVTVVDTAGEWQVQFSEVGDFDAFLDSVLDRYTAPEEVYAQQLILTRVGHDQPDPDSAVLCLTLPIDGARFAILDSVVSSRYDQMRLFDELLDGAHGILDGRVGTQVFLTGDGSANVWIAVHGGVPVKMQIDIW